MLICQPKAAARSLCLADPAVEDVTAFGDRLHLRLCAGTPISGPDNSLDRLQGTLTEGGVQVQELRTIQPSLEDVFIALQEGGQLVGASGNGRHVEASEVSSE